MGRGVVTGMQPGTRIGQYVVGAPLGQGGMGAVYFAQDTLIGRDVALKVVLTDPGLGPEARSELQRRLLREAQTAGVLVHPNVITIYHAGLEDGILFIAMELVHGCSLDRLAASRRIPPWLAASILRQAAAALDFAHAQGVLHRDVKPSNILISTQGRAKLCDFGIAKWLSVPASTASMALLGSPAYMSPEQGMGAGAGPASDQYSLAVVAYEILSGVKPFHADNIYSLLNCHLAQPPPIEPLVKAGVPEHSIQALLRGLAKDPGERYPSCASFVGELFAAWPESSQPTARTGEAVAVTISCPCPSCRGAGVRVTPPGGPGDPVEPPPPRAGEPEALWTTVPGPAGRFPAPEAPLPTPLPARSSQVRHWLRRYGPITAVAALLVPAALLSLAGLRSLLFSDRHAGKGGAAEEAAAPEAVPDEHLPSPAAGAGHGGPNRPATGMGESRSADAPSRSLPAEAEAPVAGEHVESPAPVGRPGPLSASVAALRLDPDAPWPTNGGNRARNGLVDAAGLRQAAAAWSLRLPADVAAGPVIDRDGRIYVALGNGAVIAVEAGRIAWSVALPELPSGGVDIVEGGLVRVWLRKGLVAALQASEGAIVRVEEDQQGWSEAAMDSARRIFYISGRWLRCTGLPGWGLALPQEAAGAPAIDDATGVAVVCTRDGNVYAVNRGGGLEWSLQLAGRLSSRPAAMPDGGVVVGAADGSLYSIRSGEVLWKQMLQAPVQGAPAVSRDGLIHAAAGSGCLYGLDSRGRVLWRHCLGNEIRAGPALDGRGRLLVVTAARKLECLAAPQR